MNENQYFKFEQIAHNIEEKIYNGILEPGEKLPSVRAACNELSVSASTVFKAYYELETKGLIEARNKSGYYVNLSVSQLKKIKNHAALSIIAKRKTDNAKNVDEMIDQMELSKLNDIKFDFSSATPSIEMLPIEKLNKSLRSSLINNKEELLCYEDPLGAKELRKQILAQVFKENSSYNINDLIITAGCLEAINICLNILTKSGDNILIEKSNYYNILSLLKSKNIAIHTYDFNKENQFNTNDFEKTLIEKKIKLCLITSNFHNPTGASISTIIKKKIVTISTKNNVKIIEDDVYGDLYFDKAKPTTLKYFDKNEIVYYCSSFSKTLAPGFRVGYCIPGEKKLEFSKQKRLLSLGTNSVTQAALIDFMKTGRYDFHLKKLRKLIHVNMLKYGDAILKYFPNNIKFTIPKGGYVFWIEFPSSFDGYLFYKELLNQKILITPGEIFSTNGSYKNFIRISYSKPYSNIIEDVLKNIGSIAKKQLK